VLTCNTSTQEEEAENYKFKTSLGYRARPYLTLLPPKKKIKEKKSVA
jgi:hypothetical protein